jgi:SAM-dependent methyltransferase
MTNGDDSTAIRRLGDQLRAAGLTPRALGAWAGTERLSGLPWRLSELGGREPTPAARALAVFVAGIELRAEGVAWPVDELVAAGLLERVDDRLRAPVAVLPLGASLLVCDRDDASDHPDLVCWPDDSSYHLASALPAGRRGRWLDLGSGSAFGALARPELATEIRGVDINPRALGYARLGAQLSGISHLAVAHADIAAAREQADLVTCNAPIPGEWDQAVWRTADQGFAGRLWPALRAAVAPGGLAVVHSILAIVPDDLAGEAVSVVYSPPSVRPFAVTWWRPEAPSRRVRVRRELTRARPHLDPRDRDEALAGTLEPLEPRAAP